jgi:AcrR family transcriptional regulator
MNSTARRFRCPIWLEASTTALCQAQADVLPRYRGNSPRIPKSHGWILNKRTQSSVGVSLPCTRSWFYLFPVSESLARSEQVEPPAPRRKGRPRDASADERILTAAAELILQRGYDNMTVDEVAAKAGKATVYRRWAGKEDLAFAALKQLYSTELPVPDTGSIREDLRQAYTQGLEFVTTEDGKAYLRMTIAESMRDDRLGALYTAAHTAQEQAARLMFERGIARGELRADMRIDFAVAWFSGLLVLNAAIDKAQPGLDEVDDMLDFVLNGIRS